MTDYSGMDLIVEQNSNKGTAVPNGMNFGEFQTDVVKNYNPGVSSGNAYPWLYTIMPNEEGDSDKILLSNFEIPANSSGYLQLSTFNLSEPYVTLVGTGNNLRLSLKTAVNLFFTIDTDDQNILFTACGEDQYKQTMVATTPPLTSIDTPVTCRILKDYSSIFYQNLGSTSAQITISLGTFYELRFFDVIQNSVLFADCGYPFYTAPSSDAAMAWDFNYTPVANNPLVPLTVDSTICRPVIDFENTGNPFFIKGNTLMVTQNVWGMGTFPTFSNYEFINFVPDLINNLRTVIGAEQPTEGWVGWQG